MLGGGGGVVRVCGEVAGTGGRQSQPTAAGVPQTTFAPSSAWVEAATLLRDHPELDFKLFLDLCGVDYLDEREDRFEVVLHAYSVTHKHHVRIKATLPESDATIDTLDKVYKGANWFEREAWDLYGIKFKGRRLTVSVARGPSPGKSMPLTPGSSVSVPRRSVASSARLVR